MKKILKPLVKYLISSGITYPEISELLKEIYVETAESEFKLPGKKQTDSRINFLTGIHRKDVKRLRSQNRESSANQGSSLGALLISRWLGDPNYCEKPGKPLALPRLSKADEQISFDSLVSSINKDIRSRAILDEWINMEIVELDEDNKVHLNQNAFIPDDGFEEKIWFFGENLRDHLATATHNLRNKNNPRLERAVYYDELSEESVKELMKMSEELCMEILLKINAHAFELQQRDKKKHNSIERIRLGLYFFRSENKKKNLKQ